MARKIMWIADYVHETIAYSELEKKVISTQIFNRLHNILQNSTAYLTYPSNRTSRFSHSLGCMHLAGEMFRYGIINADVNTRGKFFQTIEEELTRIQSKSVEPDVSNTFRQKRHAYFSEIDNESVLEERRCTDLDEPLYSAAVPGLLTHLFWDSEVGEYIASDSNQDLLEAEKNTRIITREAQQYYFIVVFQAVRLVGLLHDLGHPPFSHVTETALSRVYKIIANSVNSDVSKQKRSYSEFEKIVGKYIDERGEVNLHEALGKDLTSMVLEDSNDRIRKENQYSHKYCYDVLVIRHLVERILAASKNDLDILAALHRIVDGVIDVDRLDYVSRDTSMSGLSRDPMNYNRLLTSITLCYIATGAKQIEESEANAIPIEQPHFLPSARALSTIEDFAHLRFNLYRHILYHHRVAKTDSLLLEAVVELSEQELEEESEHEKREAGVLPHNISGLWTVLDFRDDPSRRKLINRYIQWDDAWLLSILRRKFLNLRAGSETGQQVSRRVRSSGNKKMQQDSILEKRLAEIVANEKFYFPLYKRSDTFLDIDESFLKSCVTAFKGVTEFESTLRSYAKTNNILAEERKLSALRSYFEGAEDLYGNVSDEKRDASRLTRIREAHGFFMIELNAFLNNGLRNRELKFMSSVIERFKVQYKLDDVLVTYKWIKLGIDRDTQLIMDGSVIRLGNLTGIAAELEARLQLFPPIYMYIYKEGGVDSGEFPAMREWLGQRLFESFQQLVSPRSN